MHSDAMYVLVTLHVITAYRCKYLAQRPSSPLPSVMRSGVMSASIRDMSERTCSLLQDKDFERHVHSCSNNREGCSDERGVQPVSIDTRNDNDEAENFR